jgi:hypothetical protein
MESFAFEMALLIYLRSAQGDSFRLTGADTGLLSMRSRGEKSLYSVVK